MLSIEILAQYSSVHFVVLDGRRLLRTCEFSRGTPGDRRLNGYATANHSFEWHSYGVNPFPAREEASRDCETFSRRASTRPCPPRGDS